MEISFLGVFAAGLLTFASPCVLPLVPVYLGILAGEAGPDAPGGRFRTLTATIFFALGFTLVFALMGLTATVVGRALVRNRLLFQQLGGVVILLLGLQFVGWLRLPFPTGVGTGGLARLKTRFHLANSFLLGLLFAFAWTPCIGSVLGAVLTYTSLQSTDPFVGVAYLSAYGLGFALPLIVVATVAGPALAALRKVRRFLPIFEKVTGTLLVAVGLLLVTDRLVVPDLLLARAPERPVDQAEAVPQNPTLPSPFGTAPGETCGEATGGTGATCGDVAAAPRARMLEFYSPTCPICLQMMPVVMTLRNECQARNVRIEPVDVSTEAGQALARRYGVRGIPVFAFVDPSDREVARLVGFQTIDALEQAMTILIGESCPQYRPMPEMGGPQGAAPTPGGTSPPSNRIRREGRPEVG
jgi:cytochrome c-type biogenesis protein